MLTGPAFQLLTQGTVAVQGKAAVHLIREWVERDFDEQASICKGCLSCPYAQAGCKGSEQVHPASQSLQKSSRGHFTDFGSHYLQEFLEGAKDAFFIGMAATAHQARNLSSAVCYPWV